MLNKDIEKSFIEVPLFPAGHREDLRRMVWRDKQFFGPRQIERRQCSIEMKIKRGFSTGLTVTQPGELFAVAEEKFNLNPRPLKSPPLPPFRSIVRAKKIKPALKDFSQ